MRFREVVQYELSDRLRSVSTWIYAAFLFLVVWAFVGSAEHTVVNRNAPLRAAQGIVLFGGMFGVLISAALFGEAAIRDVAADMDQLIYTTRLRKAEYLGGRFLAALATNAIVVLTIPLGFWVATMTIVETDALGPNRLAAYVQPLVLFLWPNIVLVGAIQFTIGALARQVIPVYIATAGIFIGYIVAANYWNDIKSPWLSALADPLGINSFVAMSRYWTAAEIQTRLVGFPPVLLLNRAIWLATAAGLLVVLHRRFRFAHPSTRFARSRRAHSIRLRRSVPCDVERLAPSGAEGLGLERSPGVPRVSGVFMRATRVRQTLSIARQSLTEVISGRGFQVGFVATVGLVLLWGWNVGDTLFETSTWPVTHLVVEEVLSRRAPFIPWLVIAVYAGELVWKHREVGTAEIVDAAPVPTGIALVGRFLALVIIIAGFQTALMIGGVLLQTLQGYDNFEPGLYFRVLFGLHLIDLVLLAALAMTAHVLVNQKYVGHMLVLLASAFRIGGPMTGIHRMLVYDSDPGWRYTDMNGFGPFLEPFLWFKVYWAAWALLLAVIATVFWVRGTEVGVRHRLALARVRFRGATVRTAGVAVALVAAVGGFVFYNTNVLNAYLGRGEGGPAAAEYERRYKKYETAPHPVVTAADLRVEIYPDEPAADIRGSYRLVNRTGVAIDSVHVVINRDVDTRSVSLDRAAKPVVVDEEIGYRILGLAQPLQPDDSLQLSFDVTFRPRGFRGTSAIQTDVVTNGSYFNRMLLPFIGYQPLFELSGDARKRFDLAPKPPMPSADDVEASQSDSIVRNDGAVDYEMIVGTAADQIAVVTAPLRRSWTENSRRYFHYGTDAPPAVFSASVFSARYTVLEDRWRDVALQIFHHPGHRHTLDRMMKSMKAALDYCTSTFGPYQFRELRIVEIPPYALTGGRAHATTIAFAEPMFITRVKEGGGDMTFFGTAHEVAHSWWAGQMRVANARGRAVLSETLANYTAMMVTEKMLGFDQARRVYDYQMDRYLSRRAAFATDVPLVEVDDHPHIAYGKGAVAMYTLREHIGDEVVNTALRRFLEKYSARDSSDRGLARPSTPLEVTPSLSKGLDRPYATALDLVRELRAVTPDALQYLLTDLFETITLWDVKTERALVQRTDDGQFEVMLDLVAKKMRAGSVGHEAETPMDDLVEVGVFAEGAGGRLGVPLYLQRHRIHSGSQTIRITVPRGPARAGVDPWSKLIDRDRGNNLVDVNAVSDLK